jgi:ribonuclease P/MRP protein subunit POP5
MIKKKIKPLSPSLRERKRYLAFEVISEVPIGDSKAVYGAINQKALEFLGTLGCAEAGMIMLADRYNPEKQRGLIRVSHKSVDKLRATLALVETINGKKTIVRSVGVSGILNKAAAYAS